MTPEARVIEAARERHKRDTERPFHSLSQGELLRALYDAHADRHVLLAALAAVPGPSGEAEDRAPDGADATALVEDYRRFTDSLLGEIRNLCDKLARNEPEGWEGSKRRGVYQPEQAKKLAARAAALTPASPEGRDRPEERHR